MIRTHLTSLLASVALVTPYDGGKAGWKTIKVKDDGGNDIEVIVLKDGNPIWMDASGNESTLGGDTITRLNGEAADNRKRYEKAEKDLKAFEGLDPAAARKAVETVGKLDQKTLIDAGEVDKVRDQITAQFTEKLNASDKLAADRLTALNNKTLESTFSSSKFIADKIAMPPDLFRKSFKDHVTFDDNGQMIIKDASGNQVRSKTKIGEVADFDEAMELIVADYPNRDAIMKGGNHQGSGNNGGAGGSAGQKVYRRSEVNAMNPVTAAAAMAEVNAGTATVTD